jgi:hypothetical protein
MTYGTIAVERLTVREDFAVSATNGDTLTVKGQESSPPLSVLELERRREDILGLADRFVPVTFSSKARLDGFYRVRNVKADYVNYQGNQILALDWTVDLDRVGTEFEVDHESRLSGPQTRVTAHAVVGERWLAPPLGHYGFWSGSSLPSAVTRTGLDGALAVYRAVPATHPRWGTTPVGMLAGRVRFTDQNALERTGVNLTPAATGWELSNGLIKVTPTNFGVGNSDLLVSSYTGGAWRDKTWTVRLNGAHMGAPRSVTILRNTLEQMVVRVMWASTAPGRTTLDITLRRGSRFLELYLRTAVSSTLAVRLAVPEAGTAGTGYVRATADDANANRYVVGSAQTFTNDLVNGGLSKAAVTALDAFVGVAAGGAAAVAGDQPDHLMAQYLGSPNELVIPVRR